ncbi:nucleoside-diphosphate sugar epimerase/dehydratase [Halomonas sp. CH40]
MVTILIQPLFKLPCRYKRAIQLCVDSTLITASFFFAMLLRLDSWAFISEPRVWWVLPVLLPVSLMIFIRLGFYRAVIRYMSMQAFKTVAIGIGASAISLVIVNYLLQLPVPRSVPVIYAMLALLTIGGVRFALRALYLKNQLRYKERILVYGAGVSGRQLVESLRHGREHEPVGFLDDHPPLQDAFIQGLKVYAPGNIQLLIERYGVDKILLAMPSVTRARRREILHFLEPLSIPVQSIPSTSDLVSGKSRVTELRDVAVEDLLGRDPVPAEPTLLGANITDKIVMVTGAGGSIGSELCRQIISQHPRQLILLEISEFALYQIESELRALANTQDIDVSIFAMQCSVQHGAQLKTIMRSFRVQTVYHAAAYKHVPMVERNMIEGLRNNVLGTLACAEAAIAANAEAFILISTDKAVRPTNIMGASKRMAELVCQALGEKQKTTLFSMVRFGNVLGSSGSVVPLFRRQIAAGGPVTVTHPEITRYFMTIPEAAQLVIQAGAMARGGDVFVLDMGEPIKIAELASHMIRLSGMEPSYPQSSEEGDSAAYQRIGDIDIVFTGLRPGEKLYEELLIGDNVGSTRHSRIMSAKEVSLPWDELYRILRQLHDACEHSDYETLRDILLKAPIDYRPNGKIADFLWENQQQSCVNGGKLALTQH